MADWDDILKDYTPTQKYVAGMDEITERRENPEPPPVDYQTIAHFLFGLLDEIDTASDVAKDNDAVYRTIVNRLQARRFWVASTDGYTVTFKNELETGEPRQQAKRPHERRQLYNRRSR